MNETIANGNYENGKSIAGTSELFPRSLTLEKEIGRGNFSRVWECRYSFDGLTFRNGCAKIMISGPPKWRHETLREKQFWALISGCHYSDFKFDYSKIFEEGKSHEEKVIEEMTDVSVVSHEDVKKEVLLSRQSLCVTGEVPLRSVSHLFWKMIKINASTVMKETRSREDEDFFVAILLSHKYEGTVKKLAFDYFESIRLMTKLFSTLEKYSSHPDSIFLFDVAPRNVLYVNHGNFYEYALCDFGLSSQISNPEKEEEPRSSSTSDMKTRKLELTKLQTRDARVGQHIDSLLEFRGLLCCEGDVLQNLFKLLEVCKVESYTLTNRKNSVEEQKVMQVNFLRDMYMKCRKCLTCGVDDEELTKDPEFVRKYTASMIRYNGGIDFFARLEKLEKEMEEMKKKGVMESPKKIRILQKESSETKVNVSILKEENEKLKKMLFDREETILENQKTISSLETKLLESQKTISNLTDKLDSVMRRLDELDDRIDRCPKCGGKVKE